MTRKKSLPTAPHKTLTVAEAGSKLPTLRQQMVELLAVAEKVGGEELRDLTDCIMGFDDLIELVSLQVANFERRMVKTKRKLGETA